MQPLLRVKGQQAELLLRLYALTGTSGRKTDGHTVQQREALFQSCKCLNRRGVSKPVELPQTAAPDQLRLVV